MKKWLSLFLIVTIILTGAASVSAASTPAETTSSAETPAAETAETTTVETTIAEIEEYGNLLLAMKATELVDRGIEEGDIVTIEIAGREYEMPVVTSYEDVYQGSMLCRLVIKPKLQEDYVILAINMGEMASETGVATKEYTDEEPSYKWIPAEDLPNPVPVVITMKEKGGYSNDQYGHAYRSENREDYPDLADSEKK